MQEYVHQELVKTATGESVEELVNDIGPDTTHAFIGTLPARGSLVNINGLVFVVLSKSDSKGTLHLEIMKPKKKELK